MEISLCMIVKNEEDTIARCINSVKDVIDEFIIVDTGSTDKTVEILDSLGIKPYKFEWINDFAAARNYAFSKGTKDYLMWLDADDILHPDDIEKFKHLKNTISKDVNSITMNYVLSRDSNGDFLFTLKRNRIVKKSMNFKWIGAVHEYLEVCGPLLHADLHVLHQREKEHTDRNLLIFENLFKNGKKPSLRDQFYYANELFYNDRYNDAIVQYRKFLDTNQGWIENIRDACYKSSTCFKINNDKKMELKMLLETLEYDVPRSDIAYRIGEIYQEQNKLAVAIYWFTCAINMAPTSSFMGILNKDTYTFSPWLQLCVCYSKKGDLNSSYIANEMAGYYHHNHPSYLYNKKYFKDINFNLNFEKITIPGIDSSLILNSIGEKLNSSTNKT